MIITVALLDLTAAGLGGLLAYLSYVGYRHDEEASYAYACAGFAALGASAVVGDAVALFSSGPVAEHVSSVFMILGFGLVVYGGEMAQ